MSAIGVRPAAGEQARIVGRDAEVSVLSRLLDEPGGRLVVVEGAPGIGKTTLLDLAATMAAGRGRAVVSGRSTPFDQDNPFGLCYDAFGHTDLLDLLRPAARWTDGGTAAQHCDLARDVHAALVERGVLVILDDLHLADDCSLRLLTALLRHPSGPVRFLLSFRTDRAPARLENLLADTTPPAVRLRLRPLDGGEIGRLCQGVTPRRHRALLAASRGNPGYLRILAELPTATVTALTIERRTSLARPVNPGTSTHRVAAIVAELGALPADVLAVAQTAAVLGDVVDQDTVAAVVPPALAPSVATAIDILASHDVLSAGDGQLTFRHPLVRAALYWTTAPRSRIGTHRRAADRLGGSVLDRAPHVAASAQAGDRDAAALLVSAARGLIEREPAISADWLAVSMRIAPVQTAVELGLSPAARCVLLARLSMSATAAYGRELLDEAATLFDLLTDAELGGVLGELPALLWAEVHADRHDLAARHLRRAVELVGPAPELNLIRSAVATRLGHLGEAVRCAELAAAGADAEHRTLAALFAAPPLLWQHGHAAARSVLVGLPELSSMAAAAGHAEILLWLGEPVAARSAAERALAGGCDSRLPGRLAVAALSALAGGDQVAAEEWQREAVQAAEDGALPTQLGGACLAQAQVRLAGGAMSAAADAAARAVDAFERAGTPILLGQARQLASQVAAARDDLPSSRRELAMAKELFQFSEAHWLAARATTGLRQLGARLPRRQTDHNGLSNREREIAGLVSEGLTNRGIAERLHLSVRTIECHVARVFTKLDVTSRTALANRIARH